MKQTLLLTFFMLVFLRVYAQPSATNQADMRHGRHIFDFDIDLTRCNPNGTAFPGATPQTIEAETIFYISRIVGNDYIISIARFTRGTQTNAKNQAFVTDAGGTDIYYKLSSSLYNNNASRLERKGNFTVGASTTLIKVRPGRKKQKDGYDIYSEFGNDFNIGISAGWKFKPYRTTDLSHSGVLGLSFSSIKVTPYTTKDFISSESTQSCITFSGGYVFEYNKFQFTGFIGLDVMSGEIGRNWIYKNRPWIGLGFGYQIFRAQGETGN